MRLIETECTVSYRGRGETFRENGDRLLIIKDDGSFLVHKSTGVKPINYMTNTVSINEDETADGFKRLIVKSKTESIIVIMKKIMMDMILPMRKDNSKTVTLGTEAQLQAWMALPEHWTPTFGPDRLYVGREIDVGNGAVDLLGVNLKTNSLMIVEMKRHARRNDVFQVERYREALDKMTEDPEKAKSMVEAAVKKAIANEATDEAVAAMKRLTIDSYKHPDCWLVASDLEEGTAEFALSHGMRTATVGEEWIHESVSLEEARTTAVGTVKTSKKKKTKTLLNLED